MVWEWAISGLGEVSAPYGANKAFYTITIINHDENTGLLAASLDATCSVFFVTESREEDLRVLVGR